MTALTPERLAKMRAVLESAPPEDNYSAWSDMRVEHALALLDAAAEADRLRGERDRVAVALLAISEGKVGNAAGSYPDAYRRVVVYAAQAFAGVKP